MAVLTDQARDIEEAIACFNFNDSLDPDSRRALANLLRRIAFDQDVRAGLLKFRQREEGKGSHILI